MKPSCLRPLFALMVLTAALAGPASAATDFPNRPVHIVVGFAPGGTTDLLARIVADQLRVIWNTSVIVENRPGADGIIATTAVHQAPADGYTLLMSTNAIVITPHLKTLPYDPIKDFEPITIVGREYHHMMVTPKLPVKSVKEFIDLAKSTSGGLTFSSAGPGSAPFLGMQRFMQAAGIPSMADVLEKIRTDVGSAMRDPVVIKRIKDINSSPVGNTAEEFRQVIKDDLEIFRRVIADAK